MGDLVRPGAMSPMPGRIGALFESLGGDVVYVGKPHSEVYVQSLQLLAKHDVDDLSRVCMVGDAMATDIRGGNLAGLGGSVLIGHGIHAESLGLRPGRGVDVDLVSREAASEFLKGF